MQVRNRRLPLSVYRHSTTAPPRPRPFHKVVRLHDVKTLRQTSSLRESCLPIGVDRDALHQIDALTVDRLNVKQGDVSYRAGDPFPALHAVRGIVPNTVLGEKGARTGRRLPYDRRHRRHSSDRALRTGSGICGPALGRDSRPSRQLRSRCRLRPARGRDSRPSRTAPKPVQASARPGWTPIK